MELYAKSCGICRHRPKAEGGFGSCPLPDIAYNVNSEQPQHDCGSFRLGDKKPSMRGHIARDLAKVTEPLF